MANIQYMDNLIREYLLYRGFAGTLKSLDADLKTDKEKGFRVDKLVDQILSFIYAYDIQSLKDLWGHLNLHMFSKLESNFIPGVKKLENGVLKLYLVNACVNNKPDKVTEFFSKLTPELQNQSEWKDWFVLPYIRNPEENATFSLHFTKQWQDILLVSLHNFFASIIQYMPTPTLVNYEENVTKIRKLAEKNESLKQRLALLLERGSADSTITACSVETPPHVLDDFYIIAQESGVNSTDTQAKGLKNLIRSMGSGTSPVMGKKEGSAGGQRPRSSNVAAGKGKSTQSYFYD